MRLAIHMPHPEPRKIEKAAEAMRQGAVIAYPTDTVYGLGVDPFQKKAIEALYRMKGMDSEHPIALVCPDLSGIAQYAMVDDAAYRVMRRLLPGPYCFILPATKETPKLLMTKRKTVGIRVPNHPVSLALTKAVGHPIVSSSATWKGEQLNDPDEIDEHFRGIDIVLDAGYGGLIPSTVVDLSGPVHKVIRRGAGPTEGFFDDED